MRSRAALLVATSFGGEWRVLVISARRHPSKGWTWPAGGIDAGEDAPTAAVREAHEEAGVSVDSKGLVALGVFTDDKMSAETHAFGVIFKEEVKLNEDWEEPDRKRAWLTLEEAKEGLAWRSHNLQALLAFLPHIH